jgi:hypothetical protein
MAWGVRHQGRKPVPKDEADRITFAPDVSFVGAAFEMRSVSSATATLLGSGSKDCEKLKDEWEQGPVRPEFARPGRRALSFSFDPGADLRADGGMDMAVLLWVIGTAIAL